MMLKNYSRQIFGTLAISLLSILLFSCGEDSETDLDMQGETGVMLVHSAPNTDGIRLFIDSIALNSSVLYSDKTPYLISKVGRRKASLKLSSSDEVLIDQDIFLNPQRNYSFFVADKRNDDEKLSYVAVVDDLKKPTRERIKLRFLNMIPDTLRLDIRTQFSSDTVSRVTFSNAAFKSVSTFQDLKAGTYEFAALKAGRLTDTVIRTQTVTFEEGKIYTMWVGGLVSGQGNKAIKAFIIQNN